MNSTEKCEFGLDTGTRHSAEKAMYQISHRNFLVVGSDISGLTPAVAGFGYRNGRSPPGLHGPQKQSQFYKLCNKTITKLLYHRLPTFLRQRTPIFRDTSVSRNMGVRCLRNPYFTRNHCKTPAFGAVTVSVAIFRVHTRHARDLIKLGTTSIFCHF